MSVASANRKKPSTASRLLLVSTPPTLPEARSLEDGSSLAPYAASTPSTWTMIPSGEQKDAERRWWVDAELSCPKATWVACCVDPGRRWDVITSLLPALVLIMYGVLRLFPDLVAVPREGVAPTLAAIAPFVYSGSFLVSIAYHISLTDRICSAFTHELDVGFIMIGLAFTAALLPLCVGTNVDGSLSDFLQTSTWIDGPVAAGVAFLAFFVERIFSPSEFSYTDRNDPSEPDYRNIHINPTSGWGHAREALIAILAASWLIYVPFLSTDLRTVPGQSPPPVAIVQTTATAVFFVAAFVDFVGVARWLQCSAPTACSHSTWHVAALVAVLISIFNVDFLLLRWQCEGPWSVVAL